MNTSKRAIFLDRDGVLNDTVDRGDNCFVLGKKVRWTAPWTYQEFKLKDRVSEALAELKALGYLLILASNQPDLAYGTMQPEDHERIMADVHQLPLDDIYLCLHGRNDGCECKKPLPGMLVEAAKKWGIDFSQSYMVGDTKSDLEAGRAIGSKVILVDHEQNKSLEGDHRVKHISEIISLLQSLV